MKQRLVMLEQEYIMNEVQEASRICIETRNPNYLNSTYFGLLKHHQLGHTFCQGYYMPPITEVYERAGENISRTNIIRLLGPDRQGIEKTTGKQWNKVVASKDSEIPGIARMIKRMLDQEGMDLYLNVNNHYEGAAPTTITKFYDLLEQTP